MTFSPRPLAPPPQPVWNRPGLNGAVPLKQSFSRPASAVSPWSNGARPGTVCPLTCSSASIGVWPIQCFWNDWTSPGSFSESAYCCAAWYHQVPSKRCCSLRARFVAHA